MPSAISASILQWDLFTACLRLENGREYLKEWKLDARRSSPLTCGPVLPEIRGNSVLCQKRSGLNCYTAFLAPGLTISIPHVGLDRISQLVHIFIVRWARTGHDQLLIQNNARRMAITVKLPGPLC